MMQEVTFDFQGKNFVVVGASSGIGKQVTLELADAGANVLALSRNRERLERVQAGNRERINIACLDATSAKDREWEDIFGNFVSHHGKVHGGVYTAGITGCTPLKMYDKDLAKGKRP